ncbi:MAG: mechanosensitive ion channel family protein [Synechococcus sp. SB0673_bin_10]|nr:mechanosensitive ion channel family protein [Synechococcus sp. SB0668_bin_13]MYG64155.1 mechanosensitive ion channel family protein [Synechococcus sp. SB0675_bin_7]MYI71843.1 mechanosensitive ion channel family protein [Synechococcus sp. SB0673_bin_10]MYK85038.1 mechanosensitive ion channel family protein [Synechococcus sp. SB0669_bin_7]
MLWLLALGKLAAGWLTAWLLYQASVRLILPLVGNGKDRHQVLRTAVQALMLFGWTAVAVWAWDTVPYEGIGDQIVYGLARLAAVIIAIHGVNHIFIRLLANFLLRISGSSHAGHDIIRAFKPMLRALLWVVGSVYYLQSIGVELEAIWAVLAAGGIGVGLALQKPAAEFFEYIYILLDKPFQGEDLLDVGGILAWVEHVGIRSTRLRSLKGELVIMTNSSLMSQPVHNHGNSHKMPPPTEHGAMEHRRLIYRFGVVYSTPLQSMEIIPKLVCNVIENIENATFSRCHFVQFGASSLDFELCYVIPTNNYIQALDVQQAVNLGIMRAFAQQGISFAFPTQTLYVNQVERSGQ